jgi:hypothetical protein
MDEQQFLTPKDVLGYAEEHIVVDQELLNYSLSNSLDDIKNAVYTRTGLNINLDNAYWRLNTNHLSTTVKHLMNKHRVTYSMTIWDDGEEEFRILFVNMRVGDQWFIARFYASNKDSIFYDLEKFNCGKKLLKFLKKNNYLKDPDTDS